MYRSLGFAIVLGALLGIAVTASASYFYNYCGPKNGFCPAGITCIILGSTCTTPDPDDPVEGPLADPMGTCDTFGFTCHAGLCQCILPSNAIINGCPPPESGCAG